MKNLSNRLLVISLFFMMNTGFVYCQLDAGQPQIDKTTFSLSRNFTLTRESKKIEVLLPVTGSIVNFQIKISSSIFFGELTIEVYDPMGEKQGNYSIDRKSSVQQSNNEKASNTDLKEIVTGQISKSIENPINGNWKVIIIPKNATGHLEINSEQLTTKQIPDKQNKR